MLVSVGTDVTALRQAFAGFPSGVAAVAADIDGTPTVMVVSSFTVGVSQNPPLVMFAVQRSSTTWPVLATAPTLGVSVLGEAHAPKARQLASKERHGRLTGVASVAVPSGAVFLDEAPVLLECSVENVHAAGDHDIVVLRVLALHDDMAHQPLVWYRSGFTTLVR
ncbi:MAG: major facilitator superfamily 1 [Frankiales bacterium]|jgi:flavin reductase (DIM6/NTAB) family NADH-FMN oxidoreductase RutF|nr:major facilitator superfamily 1 [Frankiales bacterium]